MRSKTWPSRLLFLLMLASLLSPAATEAQNRSRSNLKPLKTDASELSKRQQEFRDRTGPYQPIVSRVLNPDEVGVQKTTPGGIRFNFNGYGNPQRPFPGYVGPFQLGPVRISGSGEIRGSDGAVLSGGRIMHTDNLRDRRYPNHSTTWQVIKGLGVQSAGGVTVLRLQVRVVGSNYTYICPVGTLGVLELIDDNRRLANGHTTDGIRTEMPNPSSLAPDGGLACRTHTHGMNNTDVSWTDPPRGGPPSGGIWAIVEISGGGSSGRRGCSDLTGRWTNTIPDGSSTWEIKLSSRGDYQAVEYGMGNAKSTSVRFSGRTLRIDWVAGGVRGYYQWRLDAQCQQSTDGLLVWTRGTSGNRKSTLKRQ